MFIVGAIPDSLIKMPKVGNKHYAYTPKGKALAKKAIKKMHASKKSFWSKATGGRMA